MSRNWAHCASPKRDSVDLAWPGLLDIQRPSGVTGEGLSPGDACLNQADGALSSQGATADELEPDADGPQGIAVGGTGLGGDRAF